MGWMGRKPISSLMVSMAALGVGVAGAQAGDLGLVVAQPSPHLGFEPLGDALAPVGASTTVAASTSWSAMSRSSLGASFMALVILVGRSFPSRLVSRTRTQWAQSGRRASPASLGVGCRRSPATPSNLRNLERNLFGSPNGRRAVRPRPPCRRRPREAPAHPLAGLGRWPSESNRWVEHRGVVSCSSARLPASYRFLRMTLTA